MFKKNLCLITKYRKISFLFIFIEFFIDFYLINSQIIECPLEQPILKSGNCTLEFCSKEQFASKYCIINNPIIKEQWLNNIKLL